MTSTPASDVHGNAEKRVGGWEPAVPLGERIAWAVLLGGLPWLGVIGRADLFVLIFAPIWTVTVVGGCVWGIVRDTKDGVKW